MAATPNSTPQFTGGGTLWGRLASQVNQFFAAKVDAEEGVADNLTVTGTLTVAGFTTAPLNAALAPLQINNGTLTLNYDTNFFALDNGATTLALKAGGITNALLAIAPAFSVKGNASAGMTSPGDLTQAQLTALFNVFTSMLEGAVPASGGGTANFLRADGSWTVPVSASVPTGTLAPFATVSAPSGWLNCDGSAVSRTTFSTLFGVVGTAYGTGDGSTTFNVPDMRGRTAAGYDPSNSSGRLTGSPTGGVSASSIANTGGEQGHTLTAPGELPSHTHVVNDPAHTHSYSDPGHTHIVFDPGHLHTISDPGHVHTASTPINNTASFGTGDKPPSASAAGTIDNQFNQTTTSSVTGVSNQSNTTGIFNEMNQTEITIRTDTTGITNANAGSGGAHNTVQPTMILNWIIKT